MATRMRHFRPIVHAHKRRSILPWYFDLSGKGLFILVIVGASLLALLALAQTGRVVATGYRLGQLQEQEKELLWKQEELLLKIAEAMSPAALEEWACQNGLVPLKPERIIAIRVPRTQSLEVHRPPSVAEQP